MVWFGAQVSPWNAKRHIVPAVDLLSGLILGVAVALLEQAFELILLAVDDVQVVVSELTPLLLHLAFSLFPVALDAIPVHGDPPS
jgi:hypothetical protein